MNAALETVDLGKRYGHTQALCDCSFILPAGRVAALVGPNGAGKTTLLHLAVGLLWPTSGSVRVFGSSPSTHLREVLPQIGFVAQDHPLYRSFTVGDMLTMGHKLNSRWEQSIATRRLDHLGIPLDRRIDKLSGGQHAQVALAMVLAKRAQLILLDEPLASLDPLARRDFLRVLMEATAEHGLTVLLSSHIIADLERVCDYLIILSGGRVQIADGIDEITRSHKLLIGPRTDPAAIASIHEVIEANHSDRQTTLLVRVNGHLFDSSWQAHDVTLEDIVLAYLGRSADASPMGEAAYLEQGFVPQQAKEARQ
jgi:ABC-2 type transport system ATP-binding protein